MRGMDALTSLRVRQRLGLNGRDGVTEALTPLRTESMKGSTKMDNPESGETEKVRVRSSVEKKKKKRREGRKGGGVTLT